MEKNAYKAPLALSPPVVIDGVQGPGVPFFVMGFSGYTCALPIHAQCLSSAGGIGTHTLYTVIRKDFGNREIFILASDMVGFSLG